MSMRNSPPRQSPAHQKRRPVTIHQEESVGHNKGVPPAKPAILDRDNGRGYGGSAPVTTDEGNILPSSW